MDADLFLSLSVDLVGDDTLTREHASSLLQRLLKGADPQQIKRLADLVARLPGDPAAREAMIRKDIMDVAPMRELAKHIIILWYTGDCSLPNTPPPSEADYFNAVLWPIVRAHAPALSGGYFGHWTYPPDN